MGRPVLNKFSQASAPFVYCVKTEKQKKLWPEMVKVYWNKLGTTKKYFRVVEKNVIVIRVET